MMESRTLPHCLKPTDCVCLPFWELRCKARWLKFTLRENPQSILDLCNFSKDSLVFKSVKKSDLLKTSNNCRAKSYQILIGIPMKSPNLRQVNKCEEKKLNFVCFNSWTCNSNQENTSSPNAKKTMTCGTDNAKSILMINHCRILQEEHQLTDLIN